MHDAPMAGVLDSGVRFQVSGFGGVLSSGSQFTALHPSHAYCTSRELPKQVKQDLLCDRIQGILLATPLWDVVVTYDK